MSKDPQRLRRGALLILLAVPFLFYAAYARRSEPAYFAIGLVVAFGVLAFCLWVLRRAGRLAP